MIYQLQFSKKTEDDLVFHKKSGNKATLTKIIVFLEEIAQHPYKATGKPEALKHNLNGKWSRRINKEHRLIYEVFEDHVKILSAKGHYE